MSNWAQKDVVYVMSNYEQKCNCQGSDDSSKREWRWRCLVQLTLSRDFIIFMIGQSHFKSSDKAVHHRARAADISHTTTWQFNIGRLLSGTSEPALKVNSTDSTLAASSPCLPPNRPQPALPVSQQNCVSRSGILPSSHEWSNYTPEMASSLRPL